MDWEKINWDRMEAVLGAARDGREELALDDALLAALTRLTELVELKASGLGIPRVSDADRAAFGRLEVLVEDEGLL